MLITPEVSTSVAGAMPATVGTNTLTDISSDCWRSLKNDHLCALNFDQANSDVDYYTFVDKSTKLTGSLSPFF